MGSTIYTIILLKVCLSVGVSKLRVAILARSSREMAPTVRIDWQHILLRVRASVRPRIVFIREEHPKLSRIPRRIHDCLFEWSTDSSFIASGAGEKGPLTSPWLGAPTHRTATTWMATVVGGCVRVRECGRVRARVCVCVRERACTCVMCLQYTIIIFDPGW